MALSAMSFASCTQNLSEKPEHEIESLTELFDSLAMRGAYPRFNIDAFGDSVITEEYDYFSCLEDTMGVDSLDVEEWYKRTLDNLPSAIDTIIIDGEKHATYRDIKTERRMIENRIFLLHNVFPLVEKLCKRARESYRYITPDSIDYSVTIAKEPQKLLSFKRYKVTNRDYDNLFLRYTVEKPLKIKTKSSDPKPVHALLKQFLAEQKDVKQYEVNYEWDKGVPFPTEGEFYHSVSQRRKRGPDSLAASLVTGTYYFIPLKGSKAIERLSDEFCDRMIRLSAEKPVHRSRLTTRFLPGSDMKKELQNYIIHDKNTKLFIYEIKAQRCEDGLHILELNNPQGQRYTIPVSWWAVMRTHNTKIFWRNNDNNLPLQKVSENPF